MSPIPELLPLTRAVMASHLPATRLTLLTERLMAVADSLRAMAEGLIRMGRTIARVVWLYNVARQASRQQDLERAVLDAIDHPPLLHRRRPRASPAVLQ